jgi:dipeptidyl aminopeptidase/acylaminoacyl peptidase
MGYGVLAPNFHGSSSFGANFTKSILGQWGGRPYQDLMMGLDAAAAKYSWIDLSRAGAMGASYGGFMINWINSQTTRFKCLVCHDGVFNPGEHFYSTDELYFPETEFLGLPWEAKSVYNTWNPERYVEKMVTPELVIHGGADYRIPDIVGLSTYTALQRRGIPSKFIRFPKENHWVLNPNNNIYWHESVFAWLAQWLK